MKIGIYSGSIPPPVFIDHLVRNIPKSNQVFLYGSRREKNNQYINTSIQLRIKPTNKAYLLLSSLYYIFKLIYIYRKSSKKLLSQLWDNKDNFSNFINRCSAILPPFTDSLDIFHIQWAKTLVYYPEFISHIECPVILSLRGAHINYSPLSDIQLADDYRKYFPKVKGFHAVSDAIANEAGKYGANHGDITIIKPAVKFAQLQGLSLDNENTIEQLKIISVGRCHWKKGYTFALDAMAILKKHGIKFHYTIIASGEDEENILYQIHDLDLNDQVTFINGLSHDQVIKEVSASDLFLLSSLEEGISNAVLEAMALGIPVLSTTCGGMSEVINNNENGFLVPPRDPEAIFKTIKDFIRIDKEVRTKIIDNAKKTVIKNHNIQDHVDNFLILYKKICLEK